MVHRCAVLRVGVFHVPCSTYLGPGCRPSRQDVNIGSSREPLSLWSHHTVFNHPYSTPVSFTGVFGVAVASSYPRSWGFLFISLFWPLVPAYPSTLVQCFLALPMSLGSFCCESFLNSGSTKQRLGVLAPPYSSLPALFFTCPKASGPLKGSWRLYLQVGPVRLISLWPQKIRVLS